VLVPETNPLNKKIDLNEKINRPKRGRVGYFGRRLSPFVGTPAVFSVAIHITVF
jgi:hypothetical protein